MTPQAKYFLLIILILSICKFNYSQTPQENIKKMQFWQIKSTAKNAIRNGDLYSAIDYYEHMCKKKPDNNKFKYQLAELYRSARDYEKALVAYEKVYKADKEKYVLALYFHAQMQKSVGMYTESVRNFRIFMKSYKNGVEKRKYKKLSKMAIAGCEMAVASRDLPPTTIIQHLDTSINKAHIESSPFYVDQNTVNLVSLREDEIKYYNLNDTNEVLPKRNFHLIQKNGDKWKYKSVFDYPAKDEVNISSGVFSKDGQRFYFSKCAKNWKNEMICSIYVSNKLDNGWSEPKLLKGPVNDPKYTATQPTIGVNSKNNQEVLYFVSNRPGGKGGSDIWYASYDPKKGMFAKVRNAGNKVNSLGDEVTPYYNHQTHALYFSSNYWPGFGGYDVFKTYGELKKWEVNENVGSVINTSADDINYTLAPNRETGMVISNRVGGVSLKNKTCCDDLYEFKYTNFIQLAVDGKVYGVKDSTFYELLLEKHLITVDDIDTTQNITLLDKCPVRLYKVNKVTKSRILLGNESASNGFYFFELEHGKDYEVEVQNRDDIVIREVSTIHHTHSDTMHLQDIFVDIIPNEPIRLNNIYYEFDRSELTEIAAGTLDTTILELMQENTEILVEILSHTDSKGEEDYNIELSQARAESVVQYLIEKGIDEERLIAKGYGESMPIAENVNEDGTDNPDGRAKNRRTEFRIIGTLGGELFYENEPEE